MVDVDNRTGTDSAQPRPPSRVEFLSHEPIRSQSEDLLGYTSMAKAITSVIKDRGTTTPLTIAISAPWGVGKTSLAYLVEEELRRDPEEVVAEDDASPLPKPLIIWFNAWMHSDAPNLGAAFGSAVARELGRKRSLWRRVRRPLATSMLTSRQRIRREASLLVTAAIIALGIAFVARDYLAPHIPELMEFVEQRWGAFAASWFVVGWGLLSLWTRVVTSTRAIAKFFDDPSSEAAKGTIDEVRGRLSGLVKDAQSPKGQRRSKRRIVIFVDDLERTTPPRAVDVCEVSSQLLNFEDVVAVFVADMPAIAAAAQAKHGGAAGMYQPRDGLGGWARKDSVSYGRLFLQKLIQFQVDLPPATPGMALTIAFPAAKAEEPPPQRDHRTRELLAGLGGRMREFRLPGLMVMLVAFGGVAVWLGVVARAAETLRLAWWSGFGVVIALVLLLTAWLVYVAASSAGSKRSAREAALAVISLVGLGVVWVWLFIVAAGAETWHLAWWAGVVLIALLVVVALVVWLVRVAKSLAQAGRSGRAVAGRMSTLVVLGGASVWLFVVALGSESWAWSWWAAAVLVVATLVILARWLVESESSVEEVAGLMTMMVGLGGFGVWLLVVALGSVSWRWAWWAAMVLVVASLAAFATWLVESQRSAGDVAALLGSLVGVAAGAAWLLAVTLGSESWTWAWFAGLVALVCVVTVTAWFEWKGRVVADGEEIEVKSQYDTSVWAFAGAISLTAAAVAFAVWLLAVAASSESWSWAWWTAWAWLVLIILANTEDVFDVVQDYFYERSEASRTRKTVDEAWNLEFEARRRAGADAAGVTPDEFAHAVRERLVDQDLGPKARQYLEAKSSKLAESLAKHSKVQKRAELEIEDFVPPIPRSAIRLANKLRFAIHVATSNGLLIHSADLTKANSEGAGRVGKWALLAERWPELTWAIALRPRLMGELEQAAGEGPKALKATIAGYPDEVIREPDQLLAFLRHGVMLEDHAQDLVYLTRMEDPVSLGKARDQIVGAVTVQGRPLSPDEVAALTGRTRESTRRLMAKMAIDGQLVRAADVYGVSVE